MGKRYIYIKEVETGVGPRFRVLVGDVDGGNSLILRDETGATIFETPEEANMVGDFWAERKQIPFEHYPGSEANND